MATASRRKCGPEKADHLKPFRWRKGQSGNPKGRPKRKSFETLVEDLLDVATVKLGRDEINCREAIAGRFIEMLLVGNERALTAYLDRSWPKILKHEVELEQIEPDSLQAALDRFRVRTPSPKVARRPNGNGAA